MDINVNGIRFIIDDYFKKITEVEKSELITNIQECNWNNFEDVDVLYFASGSQTATYDFIVNKFDDNTIILTQCKESSQNNIV